MQTAYDEVSGEVRLVSRNLWQHYSPAAYSHISFRMPPTHPPTRVRLSVGHVYIMAGPDGQTVGMNVGFCGCIQHVRMLCDTTRFLGTVAGACELERLSR